MHARHDRRSFVERVAAIAAAMGAAGTLAAPVATSVEAKSKSRRYSFRGDFTDPVYTPDAALGDPHYVITFRQHRDMTMRKSGKKGSHKVSGQQTYDMMLAMSGDGDLKGKPAFRIDGISWRLHHADYDDATGAWTLHASVCSTNPDARPTVAPARNADADAEWYYGMRGDGCGCNACDYCYICGADNSHHCSDAVEYHCL